jgi:deaminated glutathione amidase
MSSSPHKSSQPGSNSFRAALVQMRSGRDVGRNISDAIDLIRDAASGGAHYIQTPEVTTLMELDRERLLAVSQPEKGNTALAAFTAAARDLKVWLHIGSMGVLVDGGKLANRSYLIAPDGRIAARYDKIHMFDVDLPNGDVYRESESYAAGEKAVLADLPWGGLGMTICYDLRFPALHRTLAKGGASFIAVPAAFTRVTGEAHWQTLLRARAVETQSFVFAAAQGGLHENGRETFGHSLIVSPWGKILAEGGVDPGLVTADIDVSIIEDIRRRLPSLAHDRPFLLERAVSDKS